jgi:hypothetical protein
VMLILDLYICLPGLAPFKLVYYRFRQGGWWQIRLQPL